MPIQQVISKALGRCYYQATDGPVLYEAAAEELIFYEAAAYKSTAHWKAV